MDMKVVADLFHVSFVVMRQVVEDFTSVFLGPARLSNCLFWRASRGYMADGENKTERDSTRGRQDLQIVMKEDLQTEVLNKRYS